MGDRMPVPAGHVHSNGDFCQETKIYSSDWPVAVYTADQMRAYAEEATRQAMERCASICKSIKYDGQSNEHYEEGAGDCHDAICAAAAIGKDKGEQ